MLCPGWQENLPTFRAMSAAEVILPRGRLFLREGWDLMPEPKWTVHVFCIQHVPPARNSLLGRPFPRERAAGVKRRRLDLAALSRCGILMEAQTPKTTVDRASPAETSANRDGGRGSSLTCGDIEPNPGPRYTKPDGRSSSNAGFLLDQFLQKWHLAELLTWDHGRRPGRVQLGVLLTCSCGWQAYLFNERFGPVALHALTCPDHIPYRERNQVMLPLILLDPTVSSQCQGRGQALLTCGDIESNPGPPDRAALLEATNPLTRGRHSGRGGPHLLRGCRTQPRAPKAYNPTGRSADGRGGESPAEA